MDVIYMHTEAIRKVALSPNLVQGFTQKVMPCRM